MLIKQNGLHFQPGNTLPSVYFLLGEDHFQLTAFAEAILLNWRQRHSEEGDVKIIYFNSPADWALIEEEALSYSLFSNNTLLDVRFDKKTLDTAGKNFLEHYLQAANPRALILIRAAELPIKQLQTFTGHPGVLVIQAQKPDKKTVLQWLSQQLHKKNLPHTPQIPDLIYQYNEGNLLSCAQILEKLELTAEPGQMLSLDEVKDQLINQCEHSLYDLATACLSGNSIKALQLLRQSAGNKTEPTLILWILSQEVRLLLQLQQLSSNNLSFRDAASQLKIWSTRMGSYQAVLHKYDLPLLKDLLRFCNRLDRQIKSSQNRQIWHAFECLALSLCSGKRTADFG